MYLKVDVKLIISSVSYSYQVISDTFTVCLASDSLLVFPVELWWKYLTVKEGASVCLSVCSLNYTIIVHLIDFTHGRCKLNLLITIHKLLTKHFYFNHQSFCGLYGTCLVAQETHRPIACIVNQSCAFDWSQ